MIEPQIPKNEQHRIDSLHSLDILDTLPEKDFDDIVRLASQLCDTPISLITFVDRDRQWFKSKIGLNVDETPRKFAFCAHAINEPDKILEVEDSFKDDRFVDNPLAVGEPHVRFYAGMPIVNDVGHALGTICVIDNKPNKLTKEQEQSLSVLASQVSLLLKLRSANKDLSESEKNFSRLVNGLDDIIFELNDDFTFKFVNKKFIDHSGYSEKELKAKYFWDIVKKGYRKELLGFYQNQLDKGIKKSYYEFPFLTKNNKEVWVGQNVVLDKEDDKIRVLATCRDITEKRSKERLFRLLSENSKDLICLHNPTGDYVYISKSVKDLLGYDQEDLIGKNPYDYMHPDDAQRLREYPQTGSLEEKGEEYRLKGKSGKYVWFESYTKPILDVAGNVESFQTSSRDISDRKEAEQLLERNRNSIEAIIENTDAAIWSIDTSYHYKIINKVYADLVRAVTGKPPSVGDNCLELNNPQFKTLTPYYEKTLKGENFEKEFRLKIEGGTRYYKNYFNPIKDLNDQVVGVSVYARDITEEKNVKKRTDRYGDGLKLLNSISSNNYLSTETRLKKSLELACFFFGMKLGVLSEIVDDEIVIRAIHSEVKDDLGKDTRLPLKGSITKMLIDKKELIYLDSSNDSTFIPSDELQKIGLKTLFGVPLYVHGELYGALTFGAKTKKQNEFDSHDVDFLNLMASWVSSVLERDQYESQLIDEKETLREFVRSAPAAIAMLNRDLEYIAASVKWMEDYGLNNVEILGKNHYELFPEIVDDWKNVHKRCLAGEVISKERDTFIRSNGETLWLKWEIRPWYEKKGKIGGVVMFTELITEIVKQEVELRKAKEEAEKAAQAKETFLSTMSHEIRTPMNAIIGISNLLMSDKPRPDQLDNLSLLKFSSTNLLSLINDILDFNKIEAGKMDLESIDFNLKEVANNVVQTLKLRAEEKGLALMFNYQNGVPEHYIGDSVRLTQVLTNLVSNAIKFTSAGFVNLEINGTKLDDAYDLHVSVTDTGIGIPEDKQESIFENFTQAASNVTREYGGTGLGLTICKKILALMGSKISVSSQVGDGSTFSFTLRLPVGKVKSLKKSFKRKINEQQVSENTNIHLLIAEDNQANQKVLSRFLDRWAFKYDFADNGLEALHMIKEKPYSMVLMDIQMPVMDGFEAVRQIRAIKEPFHEQVPIFALTASVLLGVQEKVMAAGMNGYLGKPFDPDELYEKILEFAQPLPSEEPTKPVVTLIESVTLSDPDFERYLEESFKSQVIPQLQRLLMLVKSGDKPGGEELFATLSKNGVLGAFSPLNEIFLADFKEVVNGTHFSTLEEIVSRFDHTSV